MRTPSNVRKRNHGRNLALGACSRQHGMFDLALQFNIVTAGFIVNQPTPSVSNSCSVSTSPSLRRFCSTSELFPRRPRSSHISDNLLLVNSGSVSTSPLLPPKLASVCFLGVCLVFSLRQHLFRDCALQSR